MKITRSLAVAVVVSLGMVTFSQAADQPPTDSSKTIAGSEQIVRGELLITEHKFYIVKDVTGHEVRWHGNKETTLDGMAAPHDFSLRRRSNTGYEGRAAVIPFLSLAKAADAPGLQGTERPPDAGQARETGSTHFRSLAHTLRDMADRRDLEVEFLSRELAMVRDVELIRRHRAFAEQLRAVAAAADARAAAIEESAVQ